MPARAHTNTHTHTLTNVQHTTDANVGGPVECDWSRRRGVAIPPFAADTTTRWVAG